MTRPARLIALLIVFVLGFEGAPRAERPAAGKKVKPTIAILFFDYGGKKAELEPLREGLAQMLITDLADLREIRVVERARLKAVLEEHKLAASGKVDAHRRRASASCWARTSSCSAASSTWRARCASTRASSRSRRGRSCARWA